MPIMLVELGLSASGPIRTPTPSMPSSTPQILAEVSASPTKMRATISVNSGVVAFSTDAKALAIRVWP
jgi:hypothetical protein